MPEAFHMEIEGFDDLAKKLAALKAVVENKETIHQIIATELFHATERAFEEKHDPATGKPWKQWSPGYIAHLKKIGQYGKGSLLYPYLGLDAQAREDIQQTIRDLLEDALDT